MSKECTNLAENIDAQPAKNESYSIKSSLKLEINDSLSTNLDEGNQSECDKVDPDTEKSGILTRAEGENSVNSKCHEKQQQSLSDKQSSSSEDSLSENEFSEKKLDGLMNAEANVLDELVAQKDALSKKKGSKSKKKKVSVSDNSWDFDIGTRVEAKDFNDLWHPAVIAEVDQEENEFLIHYDDIQKQDEWISKDSYRLRTYIPPGSKMKPRLIKETGPKKTVTYKTGEKCFARWKYRKFPATIKTVLEDGKYEVVFYDGFTRVCTASALAKSKANEVTMTEPEEATPSVEAAPINSPSVEYYYPKHLFDPKTDYLISKKERRDMKRKLNVKELFNIDQGRNKKNENLIKVKFQKPKKKVPKSETSSKSDAVVVSDFWKPDEGLEDEDLDIKPDVIEFRGFKDEEINEKLVERKLEGVAIKKEVEEVMDEGADKPIKKEIVKRKPSKDGMEAQVQKIIDEIKKEVKVSIERRDFRKAGAKSRSASATNVEKSSTAPKVQEVQLLENGLRVGEWCCRWHNDQPLGVVTELPLPGEDPSFTKTSVEVEDYRLPPGWSKHMVRRTHGTSAGKWDVVLAEPDGRRFRTKCEMSSFLNQLSSPELERYQDALMDFGVHRKVSKQLGWDTNDKYEEPTATPLSPLSEVQQMQLELRATLKSPALSELTAPKIESKWLKKTKADRRATAAIAQKEINVGILEPSASVPSYPLQDPDDPFPHVFVGSMKVFVIENLLRCPATGCYKNFRKDNLLRMHIKHYHKDMRKKLGATPKVSELAALRATTEPDDAPRLKIESEPHKNKKAKTKPKASDQVANQNIATSLVEPKTENNETPIIKQMLEAPPKPMTSENETQVKTAAERVKEAIEKFKTLKAKQNKTKNIKHKDKKIKKKRMQYGLKQKVLKRSKLPKPKKIIKTELKPQKSMHTVSRKPSIEDNAVSSPAGNLRLSIEDEETRSIPEEVLKHHIDFEDAIEAYTITNGEPSRKRKRSQMSVSVQSNKKRKSTNSDIDFWDNNSDFDGSSQSAVNGITAHSAVPMSAPQDTYISETGEQIKIVKMKREEIINCHCGFREEDGLMIQCELCLCWQHGMCHNIEHESQVPEKYVCSICINPARGRRSQRYRNDQSALYDGTLPNGPPSSDLRRLHELAGNLISAATALHATRCKLQVAQKKDHPKLYLWAKEWDKEPNQSNENVENIFSDQLHSNYMDMSKLDFNSIMDIDKENLPLKTELGGSGSYDSPALDLPISTSEIERLAKSVQAVSELAAPEPEAAIEAGACRAKLLRHVQRAQAAIDARLDYIEAQVAELESQEQAFEDDETAEYYPKTKQTIQMLLRDLTTLEELSLVSH